MAMAESFERGDEVLRRLPGAPTMTVLAVEGMKVRCPGEENRQYWFDTILLERCHSREASGQDLLFSGHPEPDWRVLSTDRQSFATFGS
jgi:hypothetical protein